jgi:hypothetical protein
MGHAHDAAAAGAPAAAFITLCLAEFADFTAGGLEMPVAPLFAARALGAG